MTIVGGWEQLELLGEGGQSRVFKVRSPSRVQERSDVLKEVRGLNPFGILTPSEASERIDRLAMSIWAYARPDLDSELGALKMFKISESGPEAEEAVRRLKNEIAVLRQNKPGLLKLLAANEQERWIVTEFMPRRSAEKHPDMYKGNALGALKAFRSVVETAASLHKENIVHRDIKPANVFVAGDDQLVLGDFGIVYLPDQVERLTMTNERVGPRDYMPQWGDLGERLEHVQPNFDVYMLGKLLWCMVSGRLKLPREYYRRSAYDVTVLFPHDPKMPTINEIMENCVVEEPEQCLRSAQELLEMVDKTLATLEGGQPMLNRRGQLTLPCRVCGKGFYQEHNPGAHVQLTGLDAMSRPINPIRVRIFVCNVCTHYELFAPTFPDEAAKRNWEPWRSN